MAILCCCSASRLAGSNGASNVQTSSLGSNTSMESAKTAAAAQQEPQALPDYGEQAREAAALVEWIHEQVCGAHLLTQSAPCIQLCRAVLIILAMHSTLNMHPEQPCQATAQRVCAAMLVRRACALSAVLTQPACGPSACPARAP